MNNVEIETFKVDDRKFEFHFEEKEGDYCLRNFKVEPLSPIDAELICETLKRTFEWNYENGVVEFWPKDAVCGDKDELALSYLLKVLDVVTGLTTEISLAELVIKSISEWLTYVEGNVLVSKNIVQYAGVQLQVAFELRVGVDEKYLIKLEIRGMPLTTFEASKLKKKLMEIFKDIKVESIYPFFSARLVKEVEDLPKALKLFKTLATSLR